MIKKFWNSEDGNFAVIFSIALVPILVGIGGAIDTTHTLQKAEQLQNSLDAAAAAVASNYQPGMTEQDLTEFGSTFFNANVSV